MSSKQHEMVVSVLAEVADVLGRHGQLRCVPSIDEDEGVLTVSVAIYAEREDHAFDRLELKQDLQYLIDSAQLRGFASRYGIDSKDIERVLDQSRQGR